MRKLSTFLFVLVLSFAFLSQSFSQNFSVKQNPKSGGAPNSIESLVYIHYDGENAANSVGDGGTTFIGGARFTPAILGPLTGGELRFVEFYYAQAATGLKIKIYDAGSATAPGALLLDQTLDLGTLTFPGWNQIELSTYIPISGNDLWICLEVADATGLSYPFGVDAGPADPNGDFVNDAGTWDHLAGYGLNYNWNIRGVVEDSPAPAAIFFENFDSYIAGQQVACQNPSFWTTWSNLPCNATEDPMVSSTYSFTSPNSAKIVQNNDLVKPYVTAYTTGKYKVSFQAYIPTGKAGYFNTLNTWPATLNTHWGMECYFTTAGVCSLFVGSATANTSTTYPHDAWFPVEVIVDLNNDQGQVYMNSVLAATWQWSIGSSGGGGFLKLSANDFFGATATDEMYFDNYALEDMTVVPVELSAFSANANNGTVVLNWTTETELNNQGFEIQRRTTESQFVTIGHINGNGTTTERKQYSFTDVSVEAGKYFYRLKQVDFNGEYNYSNEVSAEIIALPAEFTLAQNYPNPFNPTTSISFSLAEPTFVKLAVFNLLGEEIQVLKNETMNAGSYNVTFDAASLPSGMYLYKIETAQFTSVRKMMLMK